MKRVVRMTRQGKMKDVPQIHMLRTLYQWLNNRFPILLRLRRKVFFNAQPIRVNVRYWLFYQRCRRAFACRWLRSTDRLLQGKIDEKVRQFHTDGYVVLPHQDPALIASLASQCEKIIGEGKTSITPGLEEWLVHVQQCLNYMPDLASLLNPELAAIIEGCFESHFKIYSVTTYRLVPTNSAPQASGLWHADNFPPGPLKLMVYLTPSDQRSGALKVHPRAGSKKLARLGFFDRFNADKFAVDLNSGWQVIEGPAGTTILFDAHLIHRATPPERGVRDVVSFTLLPSTEPWDRHFKRVGHRLCQEYRGFIPEDPRLD
ncbi:MAG: phytanoyl-CoA dioxygenase family protein [Nitrospira sp.]|nr:phytanoyl-CoA dioxygenase family protein [Nitrospira sp.]